MPVLLITAYNVLFRSCENEHKLMKSELFETFFTSKNTKARYSRALPGPVSVALYLCLTYKTWG